MLCEVLWDPVVVHKVGSPYDIGKPPMQFRPSAKNKALLHRAKGLPASLYPNSRRGVVRKGCMLAVSAFNLVKLNKFLCCFRWITWASEGHTGWCPHHDLPVWRDSLVLDRPLPVGAAYSVRMDELMCHSSDPLLSSST